MTGSELRSSGAVVRRWSTSLPRRSPSWASPRDASCTVAQGDGGGGLPRAALTRPACEAALTRTSPQAYVGPGTDVRLTSRGRNLPIH